VLAIEKFSDTRYSGSNERSLSARSGRSVLGCGGHFSWQCERVRLPTRDIGVSVYYAPLSCFAITKRKSQSRFCQPETSVVEDIQNRDLLVSLKMN